MRAAKPARVKLEIKIGFIKIPNLEEWKDIQVGFYSRWNFPNCCGAIDGKHITIQSRPNCGSEYFNYKEINSIVLMAVVDHNYCIIHAETKSTAVEIPPLTTQGISRDVTL